METLTGALRGRPAFILMTLIFGIVGLVLFAGH